MYHVTLTLDNLSVLVNTCPSQPPNFVYLSEIAMGYQLPYVCVDYG
jgi:hypothetical protein